MKIKDLKKKLKFNEIKEKEIKAKAKK